MWGLFFATAALVAVSLYLPGYLALRGFGMARVLAFSFAPLLGVAAYVILGLVYARLGIWSCWATQVVPLVLVGVVLLAIARKVRPGVGWVVFGLSDHGAVRPGSRISFDAACLAGYVLFGVTFAGVLFVWYLGSPDNYAQQYDNVSHLGTIQSFVNSGIWSPFASSSYSSAADAAINPLPGGGFYPTAWYSIAAMAVTSTGVSSAMAENVANFIFVALVLPSSVFAFVRVVLDARKSVVPFGAVCMLPFAGFPWMLIHFGPLYPNLSAFCMVPAAAAVFILVFQAGCTKWQRIGLACLFVVALVSLALAQPNAVFTLAVLLAPFCIWQASRIPLLGGKGGQQKAIMRIAFGGAAFALIVMIWLLLYKAPFLQSVVQHTWPPCSTVGEAFFDVLLLGFRAEGTQVMLAVLVVVGAIYTVVDRRYLWLSVSYAFACAIYCINACSGGLLKHLFAGFWYTDPWRCGAVASLVGIFMATLGLWAVWQAAKKGLSHLRGKSESGVPAMSLAVVTSCVVLSGTVFPGIAAPGSQSGAVAFWSVLGGLCGGAESAAVYDEAEQAFVQKVEQTVSADDLIINVPDDGSAFAFAADGLRTYFRYTREYDVPRETEESALIRTRLCDIASDESVRAAVSDIGARYVLQLDQGQPGIPREYLFTYENGEKWQGIDAIRDETPGFEVVLADGDMRLYRITAELDFIQAFYRDG